MESYYMKVVKSLITILACTVIQTTLLGSTPNNNPMQSKDSAVATDQNKTTAISDKELHEDAIELQIHIEKNLILLEKEVQRQQPSQKFFAITFNETLEKLKTLAKTNELLAAQLATKMNDLRTDFLNKIMMDQIITHIQSACKLYQTINVKDILAGKINTTTNKAIDDLDKAFTIFDKDPIKAHAATAIGQRKLAPTQKILESTHTQINAVILELAQSIKQQKLTDKINTFNAFIESWDKILLSFEDRKLMSFNIPNYKTLSKDIQISFKEKASVDKKKLAEETSNNLKEKIAQFKAQSPLKNYRPTLSSIKEVFEINLEKQHNIILKKKSNM